MEAEALDKAKDVVDYIAFMINEFSLKHELSAKQSFDYLYRYGGIEFLDEFYDIEHCENPNLTLEAIQDICSQNGGILCQ
ncbi:hypothetical protein FACS1894181_03330 [Bacteroidia bacterium]|nr:hypothetical protein FACS189438_1320 [Bacteroidia bacterium]GHV48202.1 hypothetical protein FACS1894181_03330 [Bacteroidia bacterium]